MRQKTLRRFEEFRDETGTVSMLVQRIAGGETLKEVCAAREVPYSLVAKWIAETPELKAQYDAALRIWGDGLAQESVSVADGRDASQPLRDVVKELTGVELDDDALERVRLAALPNDVQRDKLRIDTRLKLASKWDRERYGEKVEIAQTHRYVIEVPAVAQSAEAWIGQVRAPIDVAPVPSLPAPKAAEYAEL